MRVCVGFLFLLYLNAIEGVARSNIASPYNPYAFEKANEQLREKEVIKDGDQKETVNRPNNLLYAKIFPLSENGQSSASPFTAFLQPLQGKQAKYEVLCAREAQAENLEELTVKIKEISAKIQDLIDDYQRLSGKEGQGQTSSDPEMVRVPRLKPIKTQSQNINQDGSNIIQCSGVTCPKDTAECKVSEKSNEPYHDKITTKVWCMGKEQQILKQDEKTEANPNKGSSVSNTRTMSAGYNEKAFNQMNQQMNAAFNQAQNKHKQAMANMEQQMAKAFDTPFFKQNG